MHDPIPAGDLVVYIGDNNVYARRGQIGRVAASQPLHYDTYIDVTFAGGTFTFQRKNVLRLHLDGFQVAALPTEITS